MKNLCVALSFVLIPLAALACTSNTRVSMAGIEGISVSGTGRAVGIPDVVLLQLGVEVEQPSIEDARDGAARAQDAVIGSLKANGVVEKDIQTVQFTVQPQYDSPGGVRVLRGYRVTNVVSAKVRKLADVGKVVDDVTRAGGNAVVVRSIGFTIDDPTPLQALAREAAIKEAQKRADELARHGGARLGGILSITEGAASGGPTTVRAPATGASEFQTPIQPGELQVTVTVQVVYRID